LAVTLLFGRFNNHIVGWSPEDQLRVREAKPNLRRGGDDGQDEG
jgi:hypothetical protein